MFILASARNRPHRTPAKPGLNPLLLWSFPSRQPGFHPGDTRKRAFGADSPERRMNRSSCGRSPYPSPAWRRRLSTGPDAFPRPDPKGPTPGPPTRPPRWRAGRRSMRFSQGRDTQSAAGRRRAMGLCGGVETHFRTMDSFHGTCRPPFPPPKPGFRPYRRAARPLATRAARPLDRLSARQPPPLSASCAPRETPQTPRPTRRGDLRLGTGGRQGDGQGEGQRQAGAGRALALASAHHLVYTRPVAFRATESTSKKRRVWPFTLHGSVPAKGEAT